MAKERFQSATFSTPGIIQFQSAFSNTSSSLLYNDFNVQNDSMFALVHVSLEVPVCTWLTWVPLMPTVDTGSMLPGAKAQCHQCHQCTRCMYRQQRQQR